MEPDPLATARLRYTAAYDAYQKLVGRVSQKLENGETLSSKEIEQEAEATQHLAVSRRELLDAIRKASP